MAQFIKLHDEHDNIVIVNIEQIKRMMPDRKKNLTYIDLGNEWEIVTDSLEDILKASTFPATIRSCENVLYTIAKEEQ